MEKITGKKLNMTQIFGENGRVVPVTIVACDSDVTLELENKEVAVVGKSKGKGFTGVMKRWGFHGGPATRGQGIRQRAPGSIGSQTPGRVLKGKKMAGRIGNARVTIKGLKIMKVLSDLKQVMVSGPVPGARNSKIELKVIDTVKSGENK
ncbi:50S ribosomal protein L3 [Patescibacteria group bacterium]|nr:50S ribosomal protein L3 [Patescibacteria group bacterium]MBU1953076.1 50S ribosomal protein L3 [Patescibacteria group bacterium]